MPAEYFKEWLTAVRNSRRILLVDDNRNDCFMVVEMSKQFCLDWAVTHDYKEAVNELRQRPFRLVVLDLDLKTLPSGIELFKWIKTNIKNPAPAIMVFSGHISDKVMSELSDFGFVMFTPKPRQYTPEFFQQMFQALAIPLPMLMPEQQTKTTDTSEITI